MSHGNPFFADYDPGLDLCPHGKSALVKCEAQCPLCPHLCREHTGHGFGECDGGDCECPGPADGG